MLHNKDCTLFQTAIPATHILLVPFLASYLSTGNEARVCHPLISELGETLL